MGSTPATFFCKSAMSFEAASNAFAAAGKHYKITWHIVGKAVN